MTRKWGMSAAPKHPEGHRVVRAAKKIPLIAMIFRHLAPRQQEILSLLKSTPLFGNLSIRELIEVLKLVHDRTYGPGEAVVTQGEPGLGLYVLMRGEVEVRQEGGSRGSQIARLGPGEIGRAHV